MDDPGFRCCGVVPIFPLPGVVFFPKTVLPLHVFEQRYRAMVRESVAGEGLIVVSLLQPGWEATYEGSPPFHEVGTVGRIEDLEPLHDGRFNLRLVGLTRVLLGEVVRNAPYRVVRVRQLPETGVDENAPEIRSAKLDLLASHGCLLTELMPDQGRGVVLDERIPFEAVVNGACANLPVDPAVRQSLLEKGSLSERHRLASRILDEVLERIFRLKALRSREAARDDLN